MAVSYPPRSKVETRQTWNAESVFKNHKAWDEEVKNILAEIEPLKKFKGRLGENSAVLLEAMATLERLLVRAQRVFMYAGFASAVDTTDQVAAGMQSQAGSMFGQVASAAAFIRPELLSIGRAKLDEWMKQDSKLAVYAHFFDDLFRKQDHVRSGEVEELLGMLADPFSGPASTSSLIANADFQFRTRRSTSKDKKLVVTQSSIHEILNQPDRKARQTAWNQLHGSPRGIQEYVGKQSHDIHQGQCVLSHARKHESSLAASLFEQNVPVEVFHNLINTFKKHLPVWHRYFEIKRKALGQRDIAYYDMWAPLTKKRPQVSFEQAVDMISESLAPMGKEYVDVLRKGVSKNAGWIGLPIKANKTAHSRTAHPAHIRSS